MTTQNMAWKDAIVLKSKNSPDEIDAFLSKYQIFATPLLGAPHRLKLKKIYFSGLRTGNTHPGPFDFTWDSLDCGVWAITSGKNLRGKTTIIEVVKWLLRGKRPSALQEDVYSWIYKASVTFSLDDSVFMVNIASNAPLIGTLERYEGGSNKNVASFNSDESFELAMEEFFLTNLGISRIVNWKDSKEELEIGKTVLHGWPALSSVMFISTNYESLFGDMPVRAGINARLMQMFLGIPWVSTLFSAKTVQKQIVAIKSAQANEASITAKQRTERIASLTSELNKKEASFAKMPSDTIIRKTISQKSTEYSNRKRAERTFFAESSASQRELSALEEVLKENKITLRQHLDSIAAGAVFRILEPTCCPCCDTTLSSPAKIVGASCKCTLCGSEHAESIEDHSIKENLEQNILTTQNAIKEKQQHISDIQSYLALNEQECESIQAEIDRAEKQLKNFEARNSLEVEIQVLRGKIEELNNLPVTLKYRIKKNKLPKQLLMLVMVS